MRDWIIHRCVSHPIGWTLLIFSAGVNFGVKFGPSIQGVIGRAIDRLIRKHGRTP